MYKMCSGIFGIITSSHFYCCHVMYIYMYIYMVADVRYLERLKGSVTWELLLAEGL